MDPLIILSIIILLGIIIVFFLYIREREREKNYRQTGFKDTNFQRREREEIEKNYQQTGFKDTNFQRREREEREEIEKNYQQTGFKDTNFHREEREEEERKKREEQERKEEMIKLCEYTIQAKGYVEDKNDLISNSHFNQEKYEGLLAQLRVSRLMFDNDDTKNFNRYMNEVLSYKTSLEEILLVYGLYCYKFSNNIKDDQDKIKYISRAIKTIKDVYNRTKNDKILKILYDMYVELGMEKEKSDILFYMANRNSKLKEYNKSSLEENVKKGVVVGAVGAIIASILGG